MYIMNKDENWQDGKNFTVSEFEEVLKEENRKAREQGDTKPQYHPIQIIGAHVTRDYAVATGPKEKSLSEQLKHQQTLQNRKWEIENALNMENGSIIPEPLNVHGEDAYRRPHMEYPDHTIASLYEYDRESVVFGGKPASLAIPGEEPLKITRDDFSRNGTHNLRGFLKAENPTLAKRLEPYYIDDKIRYLQAAKHAVDYGTANWIHIKDSKADCILSGDDFTREDFQQYVKEVDRKYQLKGRTADIKFNYFENKYKQTLGSGKVGLEYAGINHKELDEEQKRSAVVNRDIDMYRDGPRGAHIAKHNRYVHIESSENPRFQRGEKLCAFQFCELADEITDGSRVSFQYGTGDETGYDEWKPVEITLDGRSTMGQIEQFARENPLRDKDGYLDLDWPLRHFKESAMDEYFIITSQEADRSWGNSQRKIKMAPDRLHFHQLDLDSDECDKTLSETEQDIRETDLNTDGVFVFSDGEKFPLSLPGLYDGSDNRSPSLMESLNDGILEPDIADDIAFLRDHPDIWAVQDCDIETKRFSNNTITTLSYPMKELSHGEPQEHAVYLGEVKNSDIPEFVIAKDGKVTHHAFGNSALKNIKDVKIQQERKNTKTEEKTQENSRSAENALSRKGFQR